MGVETSTPHQPRRRSEAYLDDGGPHKSFIIQRLLLEVRFLNYTHTHEVLTTSPKRNRVRGKKSILAHMVEFIQERSRRLLPPQIQEDEDLECSPDSPGYSRVRTTSPKSRSNQSKRLLPATTGSSTKRFSARNPASDHVSFEDGVEQGEGAMNEGTLRDGRLRHECRDESADTHVVQDTFLEVADQARGVAHAVGTTPVSFFQSTKTPTTKQDSWMNLPPSTFHGCRQPLAANVPRSARRSR